MRRTEKRHYVDGCHANKQNNGKLVKNEDQLACSLLQNWVQVKHGVQSVPQHEVDREKTHGGANSVCQSVLVTKGILHSPQHMHLNDHVD